MNRFLEKNLVFLHQRVDYLCPYNNKNRFSDLNAATNNTVLV